MNPWFAKAVIIAANVVLIAIRAPHGQRSRKHAVVKSSRGKLEIVLLTIAWLSVFIPLIWIASPLFAFADYPLHPVPLVAGIVCFVLGLWIFHRSHADLGTNWSITLEVREEHRLITQGVYRHVRHPPGAKPSPIVVLLDLFKDSQHGLLRDVLGIGMIRESNA